MRKVLIFFLGSLLFSTANAGEIPVPFPAEITGGKAQLEEWIRFNGLEKTSSTQDHAYSREGWIVAVYHSAGSGRPLINAYVYACSPSICSLVASRMKISIDPKAATPLTSEISNSKNTFLLRTSDHVVRLKITLGDWLLSPSVGNVLILSHFDATFAFEADPKKREHLHAKKHFFKSTTGHILMKTLGQSLVEINTHREMIWEHPQRTHEIIYVK